MRARSILIICLAAVFSVVNILLAFFGQDYLGNYLIAGAVTYLIITSASLDLNRRDVADLNIMSAIVFVGFLVYITSRVIGILR